MEKREAFGEKRLPAKLEVHEDKQDLADYRAALEEFPADPTTYSLEEVKTGIPPSSFRLSGNYSQVIHSHP